MQSLLAAEHVLTGILPNSKAPALLGLLKLPFPKPPLLDLVDPINLSAYLHAAHPTAATPLICCRLSCGGIVSNCLSCVMSCVISTAWMMLTHASVLQVMTSARL